MVTATDARVQASFHSSTHMCAVCWHRIALHRTGDWISSYKHQSKSSVILLTKVCYSIHFLQLKEVSIDYGNAVCGVQNADALVTWLGSNDTFSSAYLRSRNITECNNISYDSCESYLKCVAQLPNVFRADAPICKCIVNITVPSTMNEVYLYYGLNNFFQNHRRYLNSWNPNQLQGSLKTTDGCSPLDSRRPVNKTDGSLEAASLPIAPCGLIANSFFNGEFDVCAEPCNSDRYLSRNV